MHGQWLHHRYRDIEGEAFDMTPVIDVVFLLIIFFMLVCQFIVVERFAVDVPESIASAAALREEQRVLTLTVVPQAQGVLYAVQHERLDAVESRDLSALIAAAIDEHYRDEPPGRPRIVRLRCDRAAVFGDVRPVLHGIAKSSATDVDWAVRD